MSAEQMMPEFFMPFWTILGVVLLIPVIFLGVYLFLLCLGVSGKIDLGSFEGEEAEYLHPLRCKYCNDWLGVDAHELHRVCPACERDRRYREGSC